MQSVDDDLKYAVDVAVNVVIPETENAIAACVQIACSFAISRTLSVLPAIEFDHEPIRMTGEVREVGTDRGLAAKVRRAR